MEETLSTKKRTSEDLLLELEELFIKEGFSHLTVADLAKRLSCSKRTIYELAGTKKELVYRTLARRFSRVRDAGWKAAAKHNDPRNRIRSYLQVGVTSSQRTSHALARDIADDPEASRIFDHHQQRRTDGLRTLIEEGVRAGFFKGFHPYLVAEVMMSSVKRLRQPDFLMEANMSMGEAFEEFARLIQNGVLDPEHKPEAATTASSRPDFSDDSER